MIFTAARLAALAPHVRADIADQLAAALDTAAPQFGVDTPLPRAHFMGQACWESTGFTRFEENLHYTTAGIAEEWPRLEARAGELSLSPVNLANAAYAYRNGNGSESSGDGWRYRGRGLFQLTGRNSYDAAARALGVPLLGNPDLAAQPRFAVLTALWYWKANGCTAAAERDDATAVTRIINGKACDGMNERSALTIKAKEIFA